MTRQIPRSQTPQQNRGGHARVVDRRERVEFDVFIAMRTVDRTRTLMYTLSAVHCGKPVSTTVGPHILVG